MLGLAVAVRVAPVGGLHGEADGEEREQRGDEVGARVQRLGDEAEAAARKARAELDEHQRDGRTHGHERGAPLRGHAGRVDG